VDDRDEGCVAKRPVSITRSGRGIRIGHAIDDDGNYRRA
jgi:hypothetical protein